MKKAIIVGASGLVGNELLHLLLQSSDYQEIMILVRKEMPLSHPKLLQLIVDFDNLDNWETAITGHALFCCLGTTLKKTPDLTQYRKIDHDYPLQLAQIAFGNKVKQYHLVSALGANVKSKSFYTRLKGETERDIEKVPLKAIHIYRPSLLTGNRREDRLLERIAIAAMKFINPLLTGGLQKYKSIAAATVARAMLNQSLKTEAGIFIHPSDKIKQLA
ncbi:hypothetical protein BDD43_1335 [Mucilaginibacter gracilis]|uniref:NAD(P)-binding protein n=1 Tax=Mucilaginibacter gracilis TaxID=423350 RepID=A0A495IWY8_9SPHI|nr:nucleoside-diphosphate sugar epimerase [Mucilaginibacter gracilis]RKR81190.1 hypothetical protein BDD43_1335 [Mucilaginibacter gracilis]